jgi:5'(3')-deoxyribonucleotidase
MSRLFVDMDGVLAEWRAAASIEELHSKGYFLRLEPYYRILAAVKIVAPKEGVEVYTLSAYFEDSAYTVGEKQEWLDLYLPEISREGGRRIFVPCGSDKSEAVPGGIRPDDVLLDDYPKNLLAWGGVPVKAINPHNSEWAGFMVRWDDHPLKTADDLLDILANARKGSAL